MSKMKSWRGIGIALLAVALGSAVVVQAASQGQDKETKARTGAQQSDGGEPTMEKAMFGAGCFWGVETAFRKVDGVVDTAVGYSGGHTGNPTYKQVCSDKTGHTEVVQVTYDPEKVSYEDLLKVFWDIHDPTQHNRQGPDVGSQYRSVVFFYTPEQEQAAKESKKALEASDKYKRPIATSIEPAKTFWRAEEYHQRYHEKHGLAGCHI